MYLAHDATLDRDVAFALIKTEGLDETSRIRITREAQAMGRLGAHPHIVTVFDLGEHEGQAYIVSELMGGGDVEGVIEDSDHDHLPLVLMAACGGGLEGETAAVPANVPELGAARLGAGAGPTPIPTTPTPTPTPSPKQQSIYDPVWEGTYTVRNAAAQADITKEIVIEILSPMMIGEGAKRRRDSGAILIEGATGWMSIAFVQVDPETGNVSFRVPVTKTKFEGILEGDKIVGTVEEQAINKRTFEVHANRDKSPQRRPDAEAGGFGTLIDFAPPSKQAS